jgi:DNA-binding response OmpR family regulator
MKKILVIEDDKYFRENARIALKRRGYEVYTSKNGAEGFQLAQEIIPDLILCDIMMPIYDGYWVITQIRNDSKLAKIPFIFMTAKVESDDVSMGMKLGADDYLVKPFKLAELMKTIELKINQE